MKQSLRLLKNHASIKGLKALKKRSHSSVWLSAQNGYVTHTGWEKHHDPMKKPKNPMPWLPYPIIAFLDQRLSRESKILEIGSGWGTVYWDKRQDKPPVSVEKDGRWALTIKPHLTHTRLLSAYPLGENFDIVIVDGSPDQRFYDLLEAKKRVKANGVIILDDTHREKERHIGKQVLGHWNSIYFEGLGPYSHQVHGATLFYRRFNVLGL